MGAVRSMGTKLTNTTDNFVVGDLTSIGEIGVESEEMDVTTLDSPGNFKEFIAGAMDAGEVPIQGYIKNENSMASMYSLAVSRDIKGWEVEFPDGATWTFNGFVKSFKEGESSVDGVRNFTGSIRISGQPTYTGAVSA